MVQNCYLRKMTTVACLGIWRFIMAIELSGEHFGLNRNHKRDFKIERSAQCEFDLKSCRSTISDQNWTTANSITTYYKHILKSHSVFVNINIYLIFTSRNPDAI